MKNTDMTPPSNNSRDEWELEFADKLYADEPLPPAHLWTNISRSLDNPNTIRQGATQFVAIANSSEHKKKPKFIWLSIAASVTLLIVSGTVLRQPLKTVMLSFSQSTTATPQNAAGLNVISKPQTFVHSQPKSESKSKEETVIITAIPALEEKQNVVVSLQPILIKSQHEVKEIMDNKIVSEIISPNLPLQNQVYEEPYKEPMILRIHAGIEPSTVAKAKNNTNGVTASMVDNREIDLRNPLGTGVRLVKEALVETRTLDIEQSGNRKTTEIRLGKNKLRFSR